MTPARWLFHGPKWRRTLAAWWLPRWYEHRIRAEGRAYGLREQISISALREWAEGEPEKYHSVEQRAVLALVEAVEAAHDYDRTSATTNMEAAKWAYERMRQKLAHFDFGDAA